MDNKFQIGSFVFYLCKKLLSTCFDTICSPAMKCCITNLICTFMIFYGPRAVLKQKQPWTWSSGIMPPPLLVSIASSILTTSSMSGRFSGFASQHFRMMLANELGQHLGTSGRRFCRKQFQTYITFYSWQSKWFKDSETNNSKAIKWEYKFQTYGKYHWGWLESKDLIINSNKSILY